MVGMAQDQTELDGDIFRETLEALFTTECIVLTSYLDAAVPIFYGTFLLVMVRLSIAKYHTDLIGVTTDNVDGVVDTVFLFAAVELIAFGLLAILVYRTLRLNVLYHLSFVLETQTELIQSKLFAWIMLTMAYRVAHFGMDFTFKFNWITNSS
ncbi:hypothetical protein PF005_g25015 [Phytophthora fragariae]|uniref:Uncharacterized protein n=1 Tax=Phytophthora fragariae TaxID=53985 RepID=A0A6A4B9X5_9STRA|nr:hypothetical protein PF011_g28815 [Phytophthora fragariae]KAE9070049.1 hypothetical protein PF006_g29439 [Phytophthora fragariae]KAE9176310.1 hypothetical protein PF005_g25015 [Phytophthora fragariae]KAE9268498.1 hypothetical protein PF001_g29629 [Phytophthora fragariae]